MHAFTALESLQMDDLINNDTGSSSDSSASDSMKNPTSSLHHLPAWSTTEDGEDWYKASPANSEDAVTNDKVVNDVWFAPPSMSIKKKRITFNKAAMLAAEEREISPGANTNNLKSHKSAPQLVQRVTSADHRAKLEDLLVEMGWPRQGQGSEGEAVDGNHSRSSFSNQGARGGGSGGGGGQTNHAQSGGEGSLASGMPVTSALFRRRALMREGEMPNPGHVEVTNTHPTSLSTSIPLMQAGQGGSAFGFSPHQYSKSATLPLSFESMMPTMNRPPLSTHASTSVLATSLSSSVAGGNLVDYPSRAPLTAREKQEGIARAIQAAMNSGLDPRRDSTGLHITTQPQQFIPSGSPVRRPESSVGSASTSTTELQTPLTPFQNLNSTPEIGSMASPYSNQYHLSPQNAALSSQMMQPFPANQSMNKVKIMQDMANAGTLSNALGLQYLPALPQNQPPAMIDSSAYAQIFASLPGFQQVQQQQQHQQVQQMSIKQMRSSPNLRRTTSSVDGAGPSLMKSPIRKIASNRRLAANAADNLASMPMPMPSPSKSPLKKSKSPKMTLSSSSSSHIPLPPMPSFMTSSTSNPGPTAFEFVNYGIEDADELCSAVAPSGSYKIPLKGFGGSQDGDEDDDGDGLDEEDGEKKTRNRSRSKSSNRFGPRWQGVDDDEDDEKVLGSGSGAAAASSPSADSDHSSSRQLKRIKSEAVLSKSSPLRRKTASSTNLRRKD